MNHTLYCLIDRFRIFKFNLSTRLWRINPTDSVVIPPCLVLRSLVLGWILIYLNWSILQVSAVAPITLIRHF